MKQVKVHKDGKDMEAWECKLILILVEECQTKNGCETNKYRN
jgi:hypothetical protein